MQWNMLSLNNKIKYILVNLQCVLLIMSKIYQFILCIFMDLIYFFVILFITLFDAHASES